MGRGAAYDVNHPANVFALVWLGSVAACVLLLAPAFVGAFIVELSMTAQQAGYIISVDMAGMGLATIPALFWLHRLNWRRVVVTALIANAFCHFLSAGANSFELLVTLRFAAGLFAGTAMAVCLASLGLTEQRERNFGLWVVGQLVVGAVGLALIPHMIRAFGLMSVFIVTALANLITVAVAQKLPDGSQSRVQYPSSGARAESAGNASKIVSGVGGIFLFYISLSAVWSYLERIGTAVGLSAESIGYFLSIASVAGIGGAITATVLGVRAGRIWPITFGMVTILISLGMLLSQNAVLVYAISASLFKYAWTFVVPYALAAIASLDPTGRAIVVSNIFIGGGLAVGPAIAGNLIFGADYSPVIWLGIIGMICAYLLIVPMALSSVK